MEQLLWKKYNNKSATRFANLPLLKGHASKTYFWIFAMSSLYALQIWFWIFERYSALKTPNRLFKQRGSLCSKRNWVLSFYGMPYVYTPEAKFKVPY
jgi:hypothetical protein